jgi:hypothetical protein
MKNHRLMVTQRELPFSTPMRTVKLRMGMKLILCTYTAQVITDRVILIIFGGAVTAPLKIIVEIVFHAWPFPVGYY